MPLSAPMAPRPSTLSPTPSASLNLAPNHNPGRVQSPVVANSITTATGAQLVAKGRAARQQKQSAEEPQPSGSNSNLNFAPKEHSEKAASDSDSSSSAAAKNGRKRPESGSPAGAQRASKRGRRDSTATEYDYDSGETIYSMMGYETVAIHTINLDTSSDDDDDNGDDDDQEFTEFEIDSDADRENDRRHEEADKSDSGDDSDVQDIIVVESTRLIVETDRKERDFWADSESDSEGGNFELSNYDTEMGPKASDTWMCQKCHIKNPPMVRYCGRCWKERKGWLPDRPKPKHKKSSRSREAHGGTGSGGSRNKNKRTAGQAVKSSAGRADRATPSHADPTNTSVASAGGSSEPSGSSQETLPDSGYSQSQELFSPNEEEDRPANKNTLPPGFVDKRSKTIATSRPDLLCNFCLTREKNAGIIHGRITHQICCYQCAKKLVKQRKPCPVCRRKIEKITEIIVA